MNLGLKALLVASGGAAGALARWTIAETASRLGGPNALGTLAANMIGCLLIGMAWGAVDAHDWGSEQLRLFVFTGFLGAFTTFSTFEADVFGLWRADDRAWAIAYMGTSVVGGLLLLLAGWWLMTRGTS